MKADVSWNGHNVAPPEGGGEGERGGGGGRRGTGGRRAGNALYFLYGDVPPDRVRFSKIPVLTGYNSRVCL